MCGLANNAVLPSNHTWNVQVVLQRAENLFIFCLRYFICSIVLSLNDYRNLKKIVSTYTYLFHYFAPKILLGWSEVLKQTVDNFWGISSPGDENFCALSV